MRVLLVEDDPAQRSYYETLIRGWGDDIVIAEEGLSALRLLLEDRTLKVALIDSQMPGLNGAEVCREFRRHAPGRPTHLILLTVRISAESAVRGLEAGADDYVRKPADPAELRARLRAGARSVALQEELAAKVRELETALAEVKSLEGLLPICGYCKRVRDDRNYWEQVEVYVEQRSAARFSHSICPDCYTQVVEPELRKQEEKGP